MDKPRAAAAIWPYPHRTIAEVDADALERAQRFATRKAAEDQAFDAQVRKLQAAARAEGFCASMGEDPAYAPVGNAQSVRRTLGSEGESRAVTGLPTFQRKSA